MINGDEGEELCALREENSRLTAEVERLLRLYEQLRAAVDGGSETMTHEDAIQEATATKAENERLRAALREIIGWLEDPKGGSHEDDMREATRIARAALTREGGE